MSRVPNSGPAERERQRVIAKLEALIEQLDRIPPARREAELADIRAEDCRQMLGDLKAGLPLEGRTGADAPNIWKILEQEKP